MPHFILEYSRNVSDVVSIPALFEELHQLLKDSGPFEVSSMKSRAIEHEHFFVSDGVRDQAFIHLELAIVAGREESLRASVSRKLLQFIKEKFANTAREKNCSFSVEVREIEASTYSKESSGVL